jgi:L,D-peptidoglycan transpeptidase YkuD (ErfK/YbiS/YcfS/YnhG family)
MGRVPLVLLLAALLAVGLTPSWAAASSTPPPAGSTQLVTVETPTASSTTGTLRAWERSAGGAWRLVLGPVPAYVGANGVGKAREGIATTPAGTFALTGGFGRLADPGTAMPYFRTDSLDWWDENPSSPTYNTHVRRSSSPGGASENLYAAGAVYDYAVTIGYNLERVPGAGSGIFLHVTNGRPTAGCVAVDRSTVQALLRWLRPDQRPTIMVNVASLRGGIASAWYRLGGQGSRLGLPTTGEIALPGGALNWFKRGAIYWSPATDAHAVWGAVLTAWGAQGYERGSLGYPTSDPHPVPGGTRVDFQHGSLTVDDSGNVQRS